MKITTILLTLILISMVAAAGTVHQHFNTRSDALNWFNTKNTERETAIEQTAQTMTYIKDLICEFETANRERCVTCANFTYTYENKQHVDEICLVTYNATISQDLLDEEMKTKIQKTLKNKIPNPRASYTKHAIKNRKIRAEIAQI